MKIFAISDLHLSSAVEKPMGIFGMEWENHFEKICEDWQSKVSEDDLVLLGGDISWGMTIAEAAPDYAAIAKLPGKKIVGKGNHDYYWSSLGKMRENFKDFNFLQNNALRVTADGVKEFAVAARKKNEIDDIKCGGAVIAGSRGWNIPSSSSEDQDIKIYRRELDRLKLSLTSAQTLRGEGEPLIALLHYPPFEADYASTEVTDILEKFDVQYVVYGHLHGKSARVTPCLEKNGIKYFLTSCDLVSNKLTLICEI